MVGAGVAVIAGEVASALRYKKLMDDQKDLIHKIGSASEGENGDNSFATNVQSEVFTALMAKEDATIKAGKTKKALYIVATAAYAAAAVLASFEPMILCPSTSSTTNQDQSPVIVDQYLKIFFEKNIKMSFKNFSSEELVSSAKTFNEFLALHHESQLLRQGIQFSSEDYEALLVESEKSSLSQFDTVVEDLKSVMKQFKNAIFIPDAHAAASDFEKTLALLFPVGGAAALIAMKKFTKFFTNTSTRIVLAGLMTASAAFMIRTINEQIRVAENRRGFIEQLRLQVLADAENFGACTEAQRSDTQKPSCYCFNSSGVNPARSNSEICKKYFARFPKVANSDSTESPPKSSCVSNNGTISTSGCPCKATNTCFAVKTPKNIGGYPGGQLLGNIPGTLNALNSGSISPTSIDAKKTMLAAARLNAMTKKILSDPKNKKLNAEVKKAEALAQKLQAQVASQNSGLASVAGNNSGLSNLLGASPKEALEKLKDEMKNEVSNYENTSQPTTSPVSVSDNFSLDEFETSGITIDEDAVQSAIDDNNFMSASDINNDASTDIFKILTHRYQRSAMRRLFDGEQLVPADKASESEISP
jgi:hypothetical protein